MSYAIVTCLSETPVQAAARAMTERRSCSIVVVDETGRAIGVIAGYDMLSFYGQGEAKQTVADLMRTPITVDPDLALADAADLIIGHEVHRLVVVDPERGGRAICVAASWHLRFSRSPPD